eukprot:IDg7979t1
MAFLLLGKCLTIVTEVMCSSKINRSIFGFDFCYLSQRLGISSQAAIIAFIASLRILASSMCKYSLEFRLPSPFSVISKRYANFILNVKSFNRYSGVYEYR